MSHRVVQRSTPASCVPPHRASTWVLPLLLAASLVACEPGPSVPADRARANAQLLADPEPVPVLTDLFMGSDSSSPHSFVRLGNTLLFSADDGVHGRELWRTDGTAAGTQLVKDLNTGFVSGEDFTAKPDDSNPRHLTSIGNAVYFVATLTGRADQVVRSDGTEAGTQVLTSLPSNGPRLLLEVAPYGLKPVGNDVCFFVMYQGLQFDLWCTDGTPAGTRLVGENLGTRSNFNPDAAASTSTGLMIFPLTTATHGSELWKTDGTATGTALVKDLTPGPGYSPLGGFVSMGDRVFFSMPSSQGGSDRQLWVTDGTDAGTVRLMAENLRGTPVAWNGRVYFAANSPQGVELWSSDGTPGGTAQVKDLRNGSGSASPRNLTAAQGALYFTADDGTAGEELWVTDGTSAGTQRVVDLRPGSATSSPSDLTPCGTGVCFTADDNAGVRGLYSLVGTVATRLRVGPFRIGLEPPPQWLADLQGTLLFGAESAGGAGVELWKSDGTVAGTALMRDVNTVPASSRPKVLGQAGEHLLLAATERNTGRELYSLLEVRESPFLADICPGTCSSDPTKGERVGGVLFFTADDGTSGRELWRSDGTQAGTSRVADLSPGATGTLFPRMVAWKGELYFLAGSTPTGSSTPEWGLWRSNGTADGTVRVAPLPGPAESSSLVAELTPAGELLYFKVDSPTHGAELWVSDGTAANTKMLKDVQPGTASSSPRGLFPLGNTLFWAASDADGLALWKTDGTEATTQQVKKLQAAVLRGLLNGEMYDIAAVLGNALYFFADDGQSGLELWKTDGTEAGTVRVKDAIPGGNGLLPLQLLAAGDTLFFATALRNQVWRSDGTGDGTVELSGPHYPRSMTLIHGTIYLSAEMNEVPTDSNSELWSILPGSGEMRRVSELRAGAKGSGPSEITFFKGWLVVSADDGVAGRELWSVPLPPMTCPPATIAEATGPQGAAVSFPEAGVAPNADLVSGLTYSHASGAVFPLGTTTVAVTATDRVYPATRCEFAVTVQDTTAPQLACQDLTAEAAAGSTSAPVDLSSIKATDTVSGAVAVQLDPSTSGTFQVGTTGVRATATDGAGNAAQCDFTVTVTQAAAPDEGCGCGATSSGLQALWALLLLGGASVRRRRARAAP